MRGRNRCKGDPSAEVDEGATGWKKKQRKERADYSTSPPRGQGIDGNSVVGSRELKNPMQLVTLRTFLQNRPG